jgi:hypothetical protein
MGWDGVDSVEHNGKNPETEQSTVVYAHRTRHVDYGGIELLVTVLLHRTDGKDWTAADLDVVKNCKVVPWTLSGSPCGAQVELRNGKTYEIDFGQIESAVVY